MRRPAELPMPVARALKAAVERHAAKDRRTVADTVILMLEKATQRPTKSAKVSRP